MVHGRVLVLGYNTRHIACSARRAGWEVHATSAFPDDDLLRCCRRFLPLGEFDARSPSEAAAAAQEYCEGNALDGVVLGPGFEALPLGADIVLGTHPSRAARAHDKARLAEVLDRLDIPHPETYPDARHARYPCMVKPREGGGGHANLVARGSGDVPPGGRHMLQELVEGRSASVSILAAPGEAMAVCVNRILSGDPGMHASGPFVYSGNLSPHHPPDEAWMREAAEMLCRKLRLRGSVGVDFLLTPSGPLVLEVNPRFQGSLDTVELSSGANIFRAHIAALEGRLDVFSFSRYAARGVLFAPQDLWVARDLHRRTVADQTPRGAFVARGRPLASPLGAGRTPQMAEVAMRKAEGWCLRRCHYVV